MLASAFNLQIIIFMFVCCNSTMYLSEQDYHTKKATVPVPMNWLPSVKDIHLSGDFLNNMKQIS